MKLKSEQNVKKSIRIIVESAVIGAFYAVLTLSLAPVSFGVIQFRISEALTILPIFTPTAIWGLTIGCAISNLAGLMMGANLAGAIDILIGSLATFLAAVLTYKLRNIKIKKLPILSLVPQIVFNALFVGAELCLFLPSEYSFIIGILSVGIGEAVVVFALGLPLYLLINKTGILNKLIR